ncbi:phage terminase small subunit [Paraburkholderia sp. MM5496-R1]|uniref:terminase small subunit n=1 Tax=Paraburkholderia sp. MM5496-R1 TaxID=2991065 RepID=UPI003D25FABC
MATAKQLRFVAEYLIDRNGGAAYQRAGFKATGNAAESAACRLLREPEIQKLIEDGEGKLRERVEREQDDVANMLWTIATADANELIQHRRLCCRYCYGKGFRYQRTANERERDHAQWIVEHQDDDDEAPAAVFDEMGGVGYHKLKEPNRDCPECFGEGVPDVYVPDTRHLSDAARTLYAGVKVTKDGIEVKMHARDAALVKFGEHLGMFRQVHDHKHSGAVGVAEIGDSIAPDQKERVAKEMLRAAGYVIDD